MPAIDGHLPAGRDVPVTAAGSSVPTAPHGVGPHLCRPRHCLCSHRAVGRPHSRAGPQDHGFGKGHPRSRAWRRGPRAGPCHSEPGGWHQAGGSCPAISHAAHATGMGSSTARCQVPSNAPSDLPAHCLQCHQLSQTGRVRAQQALPNPLTPFPHPFPCLFLPQLQNPQEDFEAHQLTRPQYFLSFGSFQSAQSSYLAFFQP